MRPRWGRPPPSAMSVCVAMKNVRWHHHSGIATSSQTHKTGRESAGRNPKLYEIVTRYLTYNSGSDRLGRGIRTGFASAELRGRFPAGRDGRISQRIGTLQHACWHRAQHACWPRDRGPVCYAGVWKCGAPSLQHACWHWGFQHACWPMDCGPRCSSVIGMRAAHLSCCEALWQCGNRHHSMRAGTGLQHACWPRDASQVFVGGWQRDTPILQHACWH